MTKLPTPSHDRPRGEGLSIEERIACLIDGTLTEPERERLLSEISDDPELLAVVADASHAIDQVAPTRIRSLPPWLRTVLPLSAAAALAVALWPREAPVVRPTIEALATLPDGWTPESDWDTQRWTVMRGDADGSHDQALAFRVGVRLMDARVAAEHERTASAVNHVEETVRLSQPIPGAPALVASVRDYRFPGEIRAALDVLEDGLLELLPEDPVLAGVRLEALRLAGQAEEGLTEGELDASLLDGLPIGAPLDSLRALLASWSETPMEERAETLSAAIARLADPEAWP